MRYIGSKSKMLSFINDVINKTYGEYKDTCIADLFSGTACVAQYFKQNGARVISNDYMFFSYALQIAKVKINYDEKKNSQYVQMISKLNKLEGKKGFFYNEYTVAGEGNRNYFSEENAKKIDAICIYLKQLLEKGELIEEDYYYYKACLVDAITKVSNTSGTYGAFLKIDDKRKHNCIELKMMPLLDNKKNNEVYCEDVFDVIGHVKGDILYLDPPYNSRQYPPYYHILETATLYDNPDVYGKTGRRHYEKLHSPFCMKNEALKSLLTIVERASFKHIYISYSTEGIISHVELCEKLRHYGDVQCFFWDYRRYKSNNSGIDEAKRNKLREIVIYVQKK